MESETDLELGMEVEMSSQTQRASDNERAEIKKGEMKRKNSILSKKHKKRQQMRALCGEMEMEEGKSSDNDS